MSEPNRLSDGAGGDLARDLFRSMRDDAPHPETGRKALAAALAASLAATAGTASSAAASATAAKVGGWAAHLLKAITWVGIAGVGAGTVLVGLLEVGWLSPMGGARPSSPRAQERSAAAPTAPERQPDESPPWPSPSPSQAGPTLGQPASPSPAVSVLEPESPPPREAVAVGQATPVGRAPAPAASPPGAAEEARPKQPLTVQRAAPAAAREPGPSAEVAARPEPPSYAPVGPRVADVGPPSASASRGGVAEELLALSRVRAAVASGEYGSALAQLDAYSRSFPHAQLAAEAMALRIEALTESGDRAAATALARRYLATHPKSSLPPRVLAMVGLNGP